MQVTLKLYATLTDYLPAAAGAENLVRWTCDEAATIAAVVAPVRICRPGSCTSSS